MVSGARLVRALARSASEHGCAAEVVLTAERDWASALFVGARYDVAVTVATSVAVEAWIVALPEAELPMPRQFARDVRVIGRVDAGERIELTVEVLVLEE